MTLGPNPSATSSTGPVNHDVQKHWGYGKTSETRRLIVGGNLERRVRRTTS